LLKKGIRFWIGNAKRKTPILLPSIGVFDDIFIGNPAVLAKGPVALRRRVTPDLLLPVNISYLSFVIECLLANAMPEISLFYRAK